MCGIAGIIGDNPSLKAVEKMTHVLEHRGPDGFGFAQGKNYAFGHRRLAIIDLSGAGHQPMRYMDRYVITFNGEIYNYLELKEELLEKGYRFNTNTDTEVIMAAYDCWGVGCLQRFNGMWAFVLHDGARDCFFIARDRFGKKPLYYCWGAGFLYFSSEIKSFSNLEGFRLEPAREEVSRYLSSGCVEYGRKTLFEGVYRFSHASYIQVRAEELLSPFQEICYWQLKPNTSREYFDPVRARQYADRYFELLKDAVRLRLRADVQVGSALSGGLDSSSIVYLVNSLLGDSKAGYLQKTFSSVYKGQDVSHCDESLYIDRIAEFLNVKSYQIEPRPEDVPEAHERMIWAMDSPPDSTCMSGWHTFKCVADHGVKVTIDGQGADEQLGGYFKYISLYLASLPFLLMLREARKFGDVPGSSGYVVRGIVLNVLVVLLGDKYAAKLISWFRGVSTHVDLNSELVKDTQGSLLTLIHYSDRVSMAHSVESRMPFMDYRLVEFLAQVPACYKLHNGWTKYLARLAFDGKLPAEVCWRKDKMGWPIPESVWFSGALKIWYSSVVVSAQKKFMGLLVGSTEFDVKNVPLSIRRLNVSSWLMRFFSGGEGK